MKRSYCNPLDLGYRYQHMMENGKRITYREAADPTLIYFKGCLLSVRVNVGRILAQQRFDRLEIPHQP